MPAPGCWVVKAATPVVYLSICKSRLDLICQERLLINRLKLLSANVALLVCISICFERKAHAYVDPGSGTLMFQALGAMFAGCIFHFRRRLASLMGRVRRENPAAED